MTSWFLRARELSGDACCTDSQVASIGKQGICLVQRIMLYSKVIQQG